MPPQRIHPEMTTIAGSLKVPRMINGLWQLAGGHDKTVDIAKASDAMDALIKNEMYCFDMADHYGDAELVIGHHNKTPNSLPLTAFTKWCPAENGMQTYENAEKAVDLALARMCQSQITLLQYHAWDYSDDTFLHNLAHLRTLQKHGKVTHIGLTNTDSAHLKMLIDSGFDIATNQVSCSVIDRRIVRGQMSQLCLETGVGLICYGTLLGGFLTEKWLGQSEPQDINTLNWSLRKYLRFIWAAGGWEPYQGVLRALDTIAKKHEVSISAVATRYVLDVPSVKCVIVGTRLTADSGKYIESNLQAFSFAFDDEDRGLIVKAQEVLKDLPGDCGDEYRRAPFLTAAGDLSHHISKTDQHRQLEEAVAMGKRIEYSSGSKWEPIAGYCRAIRTGNTVHISGTTSNSPLSHLPTIGGTSAGSQTVRILDIIENALKALGSCMRDVVRTRVLVKNAEDVEQVSLAHGWRFGVEGVAPANTLLLARLVGDEMLVEIEAWAEVGLGKRGVLRLMKS